MTAWTWKQEDIVISGQAARRFIGGATELEVEANNCRRMSLELDRRFPGLGHQIGAGMAVAIDGEVYRDAYLARLNPDSEIYLIPKIGGAELSIHQGCGLPAAPEPVRERWL